MSVYDQRIATRISRPVDKRLRLAAAIEGSRLSAFLDSVLDKALPPVTELAARVCQDAAEGGAA